MRPLESMEPSATVLEVATRATSAPWWGVPVIAGAFLVVGAVLGFFFTRLNDKRKADLEKRSKLEESILTVSLDLLSAMDVVSDLANERFNLDAQSYNELWKAKQFESWRSQRHMQHVIDLTLPVALHEPARKLLKAGIVFQKPTVIDEEATVHLLQFAKHQAMFEDAVRKYRGLDELPRRPIDTPNVDEARF